MASAAVERAWPELMSRLGYTRYLAQGGDVGAAITDGMGRLSPDGLVGIHTNLFVPALGGQMPTDTEEVWRAYVEAKRGADQALRDSDLDWTILRPGRLTDDAATGQVELGDDEEVERDDVTRADVAAVIVAVLDDERAVRRQWNLVNGPTAVADAVAAAVEPNDEQGVEPDSAQRN